MTPNQPFHFSGELRLATVLLSALAVLLAGCVSDPSTESLSEPADLVLWNGKIVTLSEDAGDEGLGEVEALAARDGRVVAAGPRSEIEALVGEETEVVDLEGRLALPGFVEAHAHFLGLGAALLQLDLRGAESWQAVVQQVADAAETTPEGQWITGRGWHQEKWQMPPERTVRGFPVHDRLSAAVPDHPVVLTHASGHAILANARAMELAGIGDDTPDPPGGEILRDDSGRATGVFNESAEGLIQNAREAGGVEGDSQRRAELRRRIETASRECLAKGITTFHDAGTGFDEIAVLQEAAQDGTLGLRLWMMAAASTDELAEKLPDFAGEAHAISVEGGQRLIVGGIKRYMDGALGSRGAWLLEPYSDAPGETGLAQTEAEELREVAEVAVENGVQLCVHAIGDRANRVVLDVYEETFAAHPEAEDLRWRVEHAQHLHPDDVPRFAELGVVASMQPVHCTSDGPWVPQRLGEERSENGAYVWRDLLDSGAVIASGTDAPVEDVDPVANFHAAVTREMPDGEAFHPEQALTREEALRSMTVDAAWSAFQEDDLGSLAPGKLADVVVLSRDLLRVPEEEIRDAEVDLTILGGEIVHRRRAE